MLLYDVGVQQDDWRLPSVKGACCKMRLWPVTRTGQTACLNDVAHEPRLQDGCGGRDGDDRHDHSLHTPLA